MGIKSIDRSTFYDVYDKYVGKVYQVALNNSGDSEIADEVVQAVFLKLHIHFENINMDRVEAWLTTTAKYMTSNHQKYQKRKMRDKDKTVSLTQVKKEIEETLIDEESMDDAYIRKVNASNREAFLRKISEALYEKNERWYEAITVTYYLERPQKEVAKSMGISVGSLEMMLVRAKTWLRKNYQEEFDHLND